MSVGSGYLRHDRSPFRLPRWTVRLRLTLLYAGLVLLSCVALLVITYFLERSTTFGNLQRVLSGIAAAVPPGGPALGSAGSCVATPNGGEECQSFVQAAAISQFVPAAAIALGCMVLISAGLSWFVAGRVLRPLQTMTQTTRHISSDNLHLRLSVQGPEDELKDLGDTIDGLLQRLERAFESQRRFIANASHELRTPLTMMRTSLDVAMAKPEPISPQLQALAPKLRAGLSRAEALLESLFVLAQAQHGALPEVSILSLAAVARAAVEARAGAAAEKGLDVRPELDEARVRGSRTLLTRMVENLVDNGIRYNQAGGRLSVRTEVAEGRAMLIVENGGPPLAQEQVDELAQPFRRLAGERLGQDGLGLGLSIVAAIAAAHDGSLELQALAGGGLRAIVTLPAVLPRGEGGQP